MMRSLVLTAMIALAVACSKEPAAPAAKVEAVPAQAPEAAKPAPAAAPVAGDRLSFDQSHGTVGFVGAKVTGSHKGGFKEFSGAVTLSNGAPGGVDVTIQMGSVFVDNPKLEGHLKSPDFFDVAQFQTATFKSSEITAAGDGYTVAGDLSLHGVTKRITFPAKISTAAADKITVAAQFSINRKDFAIVYPGMPDDLIRDAVELDLALAIPRAAAPTAAVPQ